MTITPYKHYQDSNILWIDKYPSHWTLTRVKYEAYVKARVGWHGLKSDDFTDEGPYLVTGSDFIGPKIKWQNCYHCDLPRYEQDPYIQLKNGDLLITKDGTIGKVALVDNLKTDDKATLNSGVFVVRPLADNFTTKFYFWLLQSSVFKTFVDFNKTGSTIVHLYQDTFVNFSYASPEIKEQTQIAAFLDHETAKIDTLIEKQQQLIELLKEKRQAVISHAVTKGLNPDAPMKDSGVEWLGEVPEHWVVSKIKNFATIESGHTPSKTKEEYWINCTIPWVSLNDSQQLKVVDYIDETKYNISELGMANSSAHLLPEKAVVFTRDASIGLSAITTKPMAVSQHLIAWICNEYCLIPEYLLLVFYAMESEFDRYTSGATLKTIGMDNVRSLTAAFPPICEQKEIINWAFENIQKIKTSIDGSEKVIALLKERRTALISAAVTGKIDVRSWIAPTTSSDTNEAAQEVTA